MEIKRSGSQPSGKGPAEYFTGSVRVNAPFIGSGALSGAGSPVDWLEHVTDAQHGA
jgi:hypothetical protein